VVEMPFVVTSQSYRIDKKNMAAQSECMEFLRCLHVAITSSPYSNINLRPKQVVSLESLFLGRDVISVLPTGYGKSLIFQILPMLLFAKECIRRGISIQEIHKESDLFSNICIIVTPLNSLIADQIKRLSLAGFRAAIFNVKTKRGNELETLGTDGTESIYINEDEDVQCDLQICDQDNLRKAHYNFVFAHPESFLSCKFGRHLLNSKLYQERVCALVIDEAHCIMEW
jgi:superfamily II DNA helicase RecQ